MLNLDHINSDYRLSVALALTFAAEVLPIFELAFPGDQRPRQALVVAMKRLQRLATIEECWAAAKEAYSSYYDAIDTDIFSAANAAYATSHAAYAAGATNVTNVSIPYIISCAVAGAAGALKINKEQHIHDTLIKLLPRILDYKIENQQKFYNSEEVFQHLNLEDQDRFLFNLDILC